MSVERNVIDLTIHTINDQITPVVQFIGQPLASHTANGGGRFTTYTYFIDDVQLYWPPGAESIYKPLVDQTITLTVAMIGIRSRAKLKTLLECIGIDTLKEKPSSMGMVLERQKAINIQGVLKKYGRYYLLCYQLQWAAGLPI